MQMDQVQRDVVVAVSAPQGCSDVLLYAQRSVRLDSPAVPRGLEILSWVRTNLGGVLTLAEFASIGDRHLRGRLMEREAIHRALKALQPRAETLRSQGIAILLSVATESIFDADFARFLLTALSDSQVADRVTVQLDSPPVALDRKRLIETMQAVCRAGCRLGVGGVSAAPFTLRALQGMPVVRMTIDRRLSDDVVTSGSARAQISAVVEHARGAGVETAASFVATSAAARELRALGVDYAQGHAFGAPESLTAVLTNLDRPATCTS